MYHFGIAAAILTAGAGSALAASVVGWGANDVGQTTIPAGLSNVVGLAAGYAQSVAVMRSGTVVSWGNNSTGATNTPANLTNGFTVGATLDSSAALRSNGTVVGWGSPHYNNLSIPADLTNAVALAYGTALGMALQPNGTVVAWGDLGMPSGLSNIVAVAMGCEHALALNTDGTVASWGNFLDFAGNASAGGASVPAGLSNVVAIAGGGMHSLALLRNGTVFAWGGNGQGQTNVPAGLSNVVTIAAGRRHSVALRSDGTVVAWGDNSRGQTTLPSGLSNVVAIASGSQADHTLAVLGGGAPFITANPVSLVTFSGQPIQLQASAIGAAPLYYQWQHNGTNVPGGTSPSLSIPSPQLADAGLYALVVTNSLGTATSLKGSLTVNDSAPVMTVNLTNQSVYPGKPVSFTCVAIGSVPLVYRWSFNGTSLPAESGSTLTINPALSSHGGTYTVVVSNSFGSVTNTASLAVQPAVVWPVQIYPPASATNLVAVSAQATLYFGLRRDGSVMSWDNSGVEQSVPANVTNLQMIFSGRDHSYGLRADGTIMGWGDNTDGELNFPVGLSNVVSAAGGRLCGIALKADGTVAIWGVFSHPGFYPATAPPSGLSNVVAVAAGDAHAVALRWDGTVVVWGNNDNGQTNLPPGLTNVVAIAAQADYSMALKSDGAVTWWGSWATGPGSGTLAGVTNAIGLAAGDPMFVTLLADSRVAAWNPNPAPPPVGLTNVTAVAAASGNSHGLAMAGYLAPYLTMRPLPVTTGDGLSAALLSRANGSLPLLYHWQLNGVDLPGATSATLIFTNAQATNAGFYAVVVSNVFGSVTSSPATLTVTGTPPVITSQPQGQTVVRGSTASFTVAANGSIPFTYQWRQNGTDLAGATDATLVLTNTQTTNAGNYSAAVSNSTGFAISSNALLTVIIPVGDALDTTGLVWTTGGDVPWFGESGISHDGVDAAQSGRITDNQQSTLQTTLVGPGSVTFWWKVSSEQFFDILQFRTNGVEAARISGEVDWQQQTFPIASGLQTLAWVYSKDGSTSAGQDTAWLDQVSYTCGGTPPQPITPSWSQNTFSTWVCTLSGKTYTLEYNDVITASNWLPVMSVIGDGTLRNLTDTNAVGAQRFYRVRQSN